MDRPIQVAAQLVGRNAVPARRQQLCRQLRIPQQDLAIFLNQQRSNHESGFWQHVRAFSLRSDQWPEARYKAGIALFNVGEIPAGLGKAAHCGFIAYRLAGHDDELVGNAQALQGHVEINHIGGWMGKNARR